jgi:hypothetical protein
MTYEMFNNKYRSKGYVLLRDVATAQLQCQYLHACL